MLCEIEKFEPIILYEELRCKLKISLERRRNRNIVWKIECKNGEDKIQNFYTSRRSFNFRPPSVIWIGNFLCIIYEYRDHCRILHYDIFRHEWRFYHPDALASEKSKYIAHGNHCIFLQNIYGKIFKFRPHFEHVGLCVSDLTTYYTLATDYNLVPIGCQNHGKSWVQYGNHFLYNKKLYTYWNLDQVKNMNREIRLYIFHILLVVYRLKLNQWIPKMIWKNMIIPMSLQYFLCL